MKKSLLIIMVLLATAGMTLAQDIWSAVTYENDDSRKTAALVRNDEKVFEISDAYDDYQARDVLVLNGHTYFAYEFQGRGYIYDYTASSMYLETETGIESRFQEMFPAANGNDIVVVGSTRQSPAYLLYATVWENGAPTLTFGNGTYPAVGLGGCMSEDGSIYVGGYQYSSNTGFDYYGVIWSGSGELYVMPSGTEVKEVVFYDGELYSIVERTDASYYDTWIYKNDEILYHLKGESHDYGASANSIFIEGGDIYVCGSAEGVLRIWKNGETFCNIDGRELENVWVNSNDVYCQGYTPRDSWSDQKIGTIWKNGEELFSFGVCKNTNGMFVEPLECENTEPRPLPYYEGFETGDTDWECWTKLDVDNDNCISTGCHASYWDRSGTCSAMNNTDPHTGDHAAVHRYGLFSCPQEGWLISPRLSLQSNHSATLSFFSLNGDPDIYGYNGVLVSMSDDPTDLSSYTELWHPALVSDIWEETTVNLSAYAGENVYIAFKYTGNNTHTWFIDDISVTEEAIWTPCDPITTFPFEEHFDADPFGSSTCWYLLDVDHDNGENYSYWSWEYVFESAWHEYGPENVDQEGWMFSPRLQLVSGKNYTLTFYSAYNYPDDIGESSVWIAVDKTGTPDPSDYAKIWQEAHPTEDWMLQTVDLSAYAGHTINIAFKYEGEHAHSWYIDDIVVEEIQSQFAVTVETNNASWGTVTGGGLFEEGAIATIHAEPKSSYIFLNWTKDGSEVSTNANYSFTVSAATAGTYKAWFGEPTVTYYTVTAIPDDPSQGMVTGGGTYAVGTEITLQAFPYGGYVFDRWNDGNTDNPRKITVNTNQNLTACFKVNAVDENGATAISVYPNPAKDAIHLEGLETETEILFYNTLGMLVKSVTASDGEISVSDLAPGLYLLRCGPQTLRFIKTN